MKVTFFGVSGCGKVGNDEMDRQFLEFCQERHIVSLMGFNSVGGFRASIYNAQPEESVDALVRAIEDFEGFN
jgi:phosphoserine aminotransferase